MVIHVIEVKVKFENCILVELMFILDKPQDW